jgi:TonB family protein
VTDPGTLTALVEALGWALVHFLWQGLVAGVLFVSVMYLLRGASAVTRYWFGMTQLAAMLAVPVVTFLKVYSPPVATGVARGSISIAPAGLSALETDGWSMLLSGIETLLPWAVLAWACGVILLSGRLAVEVVRIRNLARAGAYSLSPALQLVVQRLSDAMAIRGNARVMESARVSVPMVIGWLRPVILIPPSALMGLTPKQLELIISHELAHIQRFDHLANLLQVVAETLLFYHPVVRLVSARIRLERENCCYDMVVGRTGDSLTYARALTEVEGMRCSTGMDLSLAATGGHLRGRVTRLVAAPAPQRGSLSWVAGLVLVGTGLGAMSGARMIVDDPAPPVVPTPPEPVVVGEATLTPPNAPIASAAVPEAVIEIPDAPAKPDAISAPVEQTAPVAIPARVVVVPEPPAELPIVSAAEAPAVPSVSGAQSPPPAAVAKDRMAEAPQPDVPNQVDVVAEARATEHVQLAALIPPPAATPARTPDIAPAPDAESASGEPAPEGGKLLKSRAPEYPRHARLHGRTGFVTVTYLVDAKGKVKDIQVVASSDRIFERPVRRALKSWRFEPFLVDGTPSQQTLQRTFNFELEEPGIAGTNQACQTVTGTRLCRGRSGPGEEQMSASLTRR